MPLWMRPECALLRIVEDDNAGIMARVRALEEVQHPPLIVLRRLLVKKPRKKPIPSKLQAVAAFKYKQEQQLRSIRKAQKAQAEKLKDNPLGI